MRRTPRLFLVDRRRFFSRLLLVAGLPVPLARASQTIGPALPLDSRALSAVRCCDVVFPGDGATLHGQLARPIEGGPFPGVLLLQAQSRGRKRLQEAAARIASAGYIVLAPDLLSRTGGSACCTEIDERNAIACTHRADLLAAERYLCSHAMASSGRIRVARTPLLSI